MSVLDIDERIEVADKKAALYLRWKAEDDEFQRKHPDSLIYSWFAEHSKTWRPGPDTTTAVNFAQEAIETGLSNPIDWTPLEVEYGQPHTTYGPGDPVFLVLFYCPAAYMVDIVKPGTPPDKSTTSTIHTLTAFSKVIQLSSANITISSPDGTKMDFKLRFPPIVYLKDVTEWPDWLIDRRTGACRPPWNYVTFWVDDSCDTTLINDLIYQLGISQGEPTEYNFFRPSNYFLRF